MSEVDSAVEGVLAKITISDVVQRLKPCVAAGTNKTLENTEKNKHYRRQRIPLPEMRAGSKGRRVKAFRSA